MASVNKVILVGNCGRDPEMRYTPSGDAVANISLATSERYKDRATGENKETTEWHRIVFFGKLAEIVGEYVRKGTAMYVEGKIRTRKWTDQNSGQDRYTTEIVGDTMKMLGGRNSAGQQAETFSRNEPPMGDDMPVRSQAAPAQINDLDDDIPF